MAGKTKMLKSGERYAIVATESGRVVDTRFVQLVQEEDGDAKSVKVAIPEGCRAYRAPVGVVGIAKGRLVKDVDGLREIVQAEEDAAKERADAAAKAKAEAAKKPADADKA